MAALVLGYEVAGHTGGAITPGNSEHGFQGSVITAPNMARALALAATSIGGLYASANTSVAREYHAVANTLLAKRQPRLSDRAVWSANRCATRARWNVGLRGTERRRC